MFVGNVKKVSERLLGSVRGLALVALVALLSVGFVGCSSLGSSGGSSENSGGSTDASQVAMDFEYTDRDRDPSYNADTATVLDLAAGTVEGSGATYDAEQALFEVQQEGTYLLQGKSDGVQVKVALGDEEKAQIVFNNADLSTTDRPALYVESGDKVFVTLAEGSQNFMAGGQTDNDTDALNGVVYSKSDITFNGDGTLTVNTTAQDCHGIISKDDLVITGGTYAISATDNGLHGKDCVKIRDGAFSIEAGNDAIKSSNQEEANRGFIALDGGTIEVTDCEEGYEAREIYLNGGKSTITARDDAINASASENTSGRECFIQINGGQLVIYADGDGIDSNGSLEVNDGTIFVSGPSNAANSALDYETEATINGGTVLAAGPAGMACGFTGGSQGSALVDLQGAANQTLALSTSDGSVLAEFVPVHAYQTVVVSSPNLALGDTFLLTSGSSHVEGTVAETSAGKGFGGGPGAGAGNAPGAGDGSTSGRPGAGGPGAGNAPGVGDGSTSGRPGAGGSGAGNAPSGGGPGVGNGSNAGPSGAGNANGNSTGVGNSGPVV